jgi:aconitate hydratase
MGVLPLTFVDGETSTTLKLTGHETYEILGMGHGLTPRGLIRVRTTDASGTCREFAATARIDTPEELVAFRHGGILPYVLRQLVKGKAT